MSWKDITTNVSARILRQRDLPLVLKGLAWRLILFAVRCGRSNPISFALRPVVAHRSFRVAVGINLAVLAIFMAVYGPLPSFAGDNVGGQLEINVRSEGNVNLATIPAVQLPLSDFRITQGYFWYHPGIDMAAPTGTAVHPVMTGTVAEIDYGRFGYGNNVLLNHANGYGSRYAHLSKIEVTAGQTVTLDTEIGKVGSTGHSTGPHLHLEIYANGNPINPRGVLDLQ